MKFSEKDLRLGEEAFREHSRQITAVIKEAINLYIKAFVSSDEFTKNLIIGATINALASLMTNTIFNGIDENNREEFLNKLFVEIIKQVREKDE